MISLLNGDCIEKMRELPENSVDSIVTDPPYELGFMGKSWDNTGIANNPEMWREAMRVLKPGGHLLAFSGTRTYHRMAVAIEDAGFEVRDMIEWVYGSGFPKSLNIGKAVDKRGGLSVSWFGEWLRYWREDQKIPQKEIAKLFPSKTGKLTGCVANWELGFNMPTNEQFNLICETFALPFDSMEEAERQITGMHTSGIGKAFGDGKWESGKDEVIETKGTSEWEGWGTALKPAHEPICMARKPLAEKTVAENVLKYGTGGINIDESRVATEDKMSYSSSEKQGVTQFGTGTTEQSPLGRFPANLIHDNSEEVRECFPDSKSSNAIRHNKKDNFKFFSEGEKKPAVTSFGFSDEGNASRFFKSIIYQAKSSKRDRNSGLDSTLTVKYNSGVCKEENMVAVQLLQRVISEQELVSFNIDESGENIMAQCHKDSLFTTLTKTSKIIELKTLHSLMRSLTSEYIAVANSEMESGGNPVESVESLRRWLLDITHGKMESAHGVSLVALQMLSLINVEENWKPMTNIHSTVKPIALMSYLIKMVTPEGGTVLDPFMGSGSTGVAAKQNGYGFIGIDMTPEYVEIAKARLDATDKNHK